MFCCIFGHRMCAGYRVFYVAGGARVPTANMTATEGAASVFFLDKRAERNGRSV